MHGDRADAEEGCGLERSHRRAARSAATITQPHILSTWGEECLQRPHPVQPASIKYLQSTRLGAAVGVRTCGPWEKGSWVDGFRWEKTGLK